MKLKTVECSRSWPALVIVAAIFTVTLPAQENASKPSDSHETWRFIVSGDSRNCGDVVMPAIAAHSARFSPSFYWHLGDLRAIYKVDEDMAAASRKAGQSLTCEAYHKLAWPDFITHQIEPFGATPFFIGMGNHETIPPKNLEKFTAQFADWLDAPILRQQRLQDDPQDRLPQAYYHWTQGKVGFLYLNNSSNSISAEQQAWLDRVLAQDSTDPNIRSIVVGMHEALPHSQAPGHAMGDNPDNHESLESGERVYQALLAFRRSTGKPVYLLASHSHFFMEGIFDNHPEDRRLPGWIVGTAGAVRYELPKDHPASARTDVYGYLLATVHTDGTIEFAFQQVRMSDVPATVRRLYPHEFVPWCFAHNSKHVDPKAEDPRDCLEGSGH